MPQVRPLPHPAARSGPADARTADMHLLDKLRALLRYRWIAAAVFAVVVRRGSAHLLRTPLYRATARLLIELEDERSLAMEGVGSAANSEYTSTPSRTSRRNTASSPAASWPRRAVNRLDLRTLPDLNGSEPPAGGGGCGSAACVRRPPAAWLRGAPEPLPPAPGALADESTAQFS